jgi:cysteinyl-tRNA synthetase
MYMVAQFTNKLCRANEAGEPFDKISRHFENEFLADMAQCGVLPPDVMTRVSEYVPEIVSFIQKIIDNGFAYESNGSVYFNVSKFSADKSHTYAKLVPENANNAEALEEGEGVLSAKAVGHADDKHSPSDFALWKKSKEGEPWWDSPWGQGRPGWHIECSTMCQATLGEFAGGPIDMHSGGIDLRFPHHDNEIAQSEAFLNHPQWVNYFLHTGHLNIDGLKMSKSLKNFIKISSAIERYGARRLRLLFLLYKYNAPMDYSEDVMVLVTSIERSFVEYFTNVKTALRSLPTSGPAKWSSREIALASVVDHAKARVRAALCDDFDTPVCFTLAL